MKRCAVTEFSLDEFLPYQLSVLSAHISREFSEIYAENFGLTVPEWRVIVHLHNAGPVSVREIQARVDMDKSKVSRAATRLEKSGHITKETNAEDRRLLKLALTGKGHALMKELIPLAQKFEQKLSDRLGADNEVLREMIAKFVKASQ
ncbi:MAG: MarR family transcriptional regulator [Amylibacter sp.]|nr:MarR family transcriptional regulator [Amylibacter sp.]